MAKPTWCSFLGDSSFASVVSLLGVRTASQAPLLGSPTVQRAVMDPRWVARWVEQRTGRTAGTPAPDLRAVLEPLGFAGPARDDFRRFEELLRPRSSRSFVGRCVADDTGAFAVSVYRADRPGPNIAVGDSYFSGVQLSGLVASGVVLVEPHVLRKLCVNGAAVHVAAQTSAYARWSAEDTEGDLEQVIELGFSGALASQLQADLRRAAITPQPRLADLRARGLLRIDDTLAATIAEAAREEPPSLYGLFNAITRVARDAPDVRTAVSLERGAGRLIAALIRHPNVDPVGSGALAPS